MSTCTMEAPGVCRRNATRAAVAEPRRGVRFPLPPERHTTQMWLDALHPERVFRTMAGEELRVLWPGHSNRHEGPDFLSASVIIQGRLVRGDIEIHTHADDWWKHGHDGDPAYAGVVLHVCLYAPTRRGPLPPTLLLPGQTEATFREAWAAVIPARHPMACAAVVNRVALHPHADVMLLLMAGRRFSRKCDRFGARHAELSLRLDSRDALRQLAWEACARAAGYGGNEDRMERAAVALPLARVLALPAVDRGARLAAAAGKSGAATLHDGWHDSGVLPSNRPMRRLQWLAVFSERLATVEWWDALYAVTPEDSGAYAPLFVIKGEGGSPGPERCSELITNVVAPLLHLSADLYERPELARAARALYFGRLSVSANRITRIVAPVLAPRPPLSSLQQQGMIELFTTLCSSSHCAHCLLRSQ